MSDEEIAALENKTGVFSEEIKTISSKIKENQHDETRAKNENDYHRNIGYIVRKHITFDDAGQATVDDEGKHIFFEVFSAKDLSRVNKDAGHDGGDYVLRSHVAAARHAFGDLEVYRVFGGDFVIIGNADDPKHNISQAEQQLLNTKVGYQENSEPSRVTAANLTLDQVVDFYNGYVRTLKPEELTEKTQAKFFAQQLVNLMSYKSEQVKLTSFVEEVAKGEVDKDYYDKYVAFQFRGTALADFETIKMSGEGSNVVRHTVNELALLRGFQGQNMVYAASEVLGTAVRKSIEDGTYQSLLEQSVQRATSELAQESIALTQYLFDWDSQHYRNDQLKYIQDYKNLMDVLTYSTNGEERSKAIGTLYTLLKEHGALDILPAEKMETLGQVVNAKPSEVDPAIATNFFELASVMQIELYQRYDMLTGLPNKAEFNRELKKWEEDPDKEGNFSVVSVDLGFLKYFNFAGGRETGNLAVQKAAWLLENTGNMMMDNLKGYEIKVYRDGGDEFKILINGRDPKTHLADFSSQLQALGSKPEGYNQRQNWEVPGSPEARKNYQPTRLQVDFGAAEREEAREVLGELIQHENNPFSELETQAIAKGLVTNNLKELSADERRYYLRSLRDVQEKLADLVLDTLKTEKRFLTLLDEYSWISSYPPAGEYDPAAAPETLHPMWVNFLEKLKFSGKAMDGRTYEDFVRITETAKKLRIRIPPINDDDRDALTQEFYKTSPQQSSDKAIEDLIEAFSRNSRSRGF